MSKHRILAPVAGVLLAAALALAGDSPSLFGSPSRFDAGRLQTGRFAYRIVKGGEEMARFTLTVRRQADGRYAFTGEAQGFDQRWESVATPSFEPVSAALRMTRAGKPYAMRLSYSSGAVTGGETEGGADPGAPAPRESAIRDRVPPGTVDQRIDWAAMLSCSLAPGQKLAFAVYDPKTGVSPVEASAGGSGRITVPAGAFDTVDYEYRIRKTGGTEAYRIYATRAAPRVMVREDFPRGEVTELVEFTAEPGAPSGHR